MAALPGGGLPQAGFATRSGGTVQGGPIPEANADQRHGGNIGFSGGIQVLLCLQQQQAPAPEGHQISSTMDDT